jgi:dihydrofolate reductase
MISLIVAISPDRVIGIGNQIPWHHSADLKRFKALTQGATVIMGRNTYESIGKPLPKRRNLVVTRATIAGVECFPSLDGALAAVEGDAWIIGGAQLYKEGLRVCDRIDVTFVPDRPSPDGAVLFPPIDEHVFEAGPLERFDDEPALTRRAYTRRK